MLSAQVRQKSAKKKVIKKRNARKASRKKKEEVDSNELTAAELREIDERCQLRIELAMKKRKEQDAALRAELAGNQ